MVVTQADHPEVLAMRLDATASRNAFDAVAEVTLVAAGDDGTTAERAARTNASGMIASTGQRPWGA